MSRLWMKMRLMMRKLGRSCCGEGCLVARLCQLGSSVTMTIQKTRARRAVECFEEQGDREQRRAERKKKCRVTSTITTPSPRSKQHHQKSSKEAHTSTAISFLLVLASRSSSSSIQAQAVEFRVAG